MSWHDLSEADRHKLLKELFIKVVFEHEDFPGFLVEEDIQIIRNNIKAAGYTKPRETRYLIRLEFEEMVHRYEQDHEGFRIFYFFFYDTVSKIKFGDLQLFSSVSEYNICLYFNFNIEAILLWYNNKN